MLHPAILRRRRLGGNPLAAYAVADVNPALVFDPTEWFFYANGGRRQFKDMATWLNVNTTTMGARVPSGDFADTQFYISGDAMAGLDLSGGLTIAVDQLITYADGDSTTQATLYRMEEGADYIQTILATDGARTGRMVAATRGGSYLADTGEQITPGTARPASIAVRHTTGATQVALNGVGGTQTAGGTFPSFSTPSGPYGLRLANTTPAYPAQEITVLRVRIWEGDPFGSAGIGAVSDTFTVSGWTVPPQVKVLFYGDSLTQSDYPNTVHDLLPSHVDVKEGRGSTGSRHIAARMGAITVDMTVSGDEIVSGANTITHIEGYALAPGLGQQADGSDNQFLSRGDSATTDSLTGTLGGVHGTLVRTVGGGGIVGVDDEVYTFTPSAGETLPVTLGGDATWQTDDLYRGNGNVWVIWPGSNDLGFGQIASRFDSYAAAICTYLAGEDYIFMGPINRTGNDQSDWWSGGSIYIEMTYANGVAATQAGSNYFDIQDFLVNDALAVAGLTATSQDLTDISRDTPPTSLKADYIHHNDDGNYAIGKKVYDLIAARFL